MIDASFAALAAARWLHFLAAMLLFGAALFPFYAASDDLTASPAVLNSARRAVRVAAVLTAISAFAWAAILLITITGAADSLIDRDTLSAFFFDTGFGKVWALRLLLALAIPFVAFVAGKRGSVTPLRAVRRHGSSSWDMRYTCLAQAYGSAASCRWG